MPDLLAGWPGTWPVIASAGPASPREDRREPESATAAEQGREIPDAERADGPETGGSQMIVGRTS